MYNEIYTSTLRAGKRSYFFDVKKASTGKLYLDICESKKKDDGTFERHSILVFTEDMKQFKNEIVELFEKYFNSNAI